MPHRRALVAAVSSSSTSMRGLALDQSDQVLEAAAGAAGAAAGAGAPGAAAGAGGEAGNSAAGQQLEQLGLKDTMLNWVSWLKQEYGPGPGGEDGGSAAGASGRSRRQLLAVQQVVAAIAEAVGGQ
jgi:hypothetical protein